MRVRATVRVRVRVRVSILTLAVSDGQRGGELALVQEDAAQVLARHVLQQLRRQLGELGREPSLAFDEVAAHLVRVRVRVGVRP